MKAPPPPHEIPSKYLDQMEDLYHGFHIVLCNDVWWEITLIDYLNFCLLLRVHVLNYIWQFYWTEHTKYQHWSFNKIIMCFQLHLTMIGTCIVFIRQLSFTGTRSDWLNVLLPPLSCNSSCYIIKPVWVWSITCDTIGVWILRAAARLFPTEKVFIVLLWHFCLTLFAITSKCLIMTWLETLVFLYHVLLCTACDVLLQILVDALSF